MNTVLHVLYAQFQTQEGMDHHIINLVENAGLNGAIEDFDDGTNRAVIVNRRPGPCNKENYSRD